VAPSALACLCAAALVLISALAVAQEQAPPPAAQPQEDAGVFGSVGRWFGEQAANINSTFKDARKQVENFGHEAGLAAKTTATGAKDAADAVARIPAARVVTGHEKCFMAPNGAPDCIAAANAVCKAKGFESGKSVDMTTAETCPPKVYLSGRSTGPGCSTETFVSRALCQ
jgi:hypothetical protein